MRYRWRLPATNASANGQASEVGLAETEAARELSRSINVPESIAQILVSRGVRTFEEAREFFRPSLDRLHDPFLMDDIARAVARIRTALQEGERITIYGDYDVDGTTSTAMLMLLFHSIGARAEQAVTYHIPDRFTEGYGLSVAGIDRCFASEEGAPSLIITIDCGITSIDAVAYAKSRGAEIIICDHHEPVRDNG